MGEEYLFEKNQNIETLNKYKFNTVITACPHCFQVIAKEYKDFGGDYNVVHHSQYIQELIDTKIKVSETLDGTVPYHDACYLGRYNDVYEGSRSIIESMLSENGEIVEMKDNKSGGYAAVLVEVICGMKYKRVIELISKDLSRRLILK